MSDENKSAQLKVHKDIELITRFLNRQLDAAGAAHVQKLIEEDKDFRDLAEPLLYVWTELPTYAERHPRPPGELERHWDRFTKRAGFIHQRRKARRRLLGGLTMIIAVLGLTAFLLRDQIHEQYVDRRDYYVAAEGPDTVQLHDGIRATLASGSVLRQLKRPVVRSVAQTKLQGDARFDVAIIPTIGSPMRIQALIVAGRNGAVSSGNADFSMTTRGDTTDIQVFRRAPSSSRLSSVVPDYVSLKGAGHVLPQLTLREGERGQLVRGKDPVALEATVSAPSPAPVPAPTSSLLRAAQVAAPSAPVKPQPRTAQPAQPAQPAAKPPAARDTARWVDLAFGIRAQIAPHAKLWDEGVSRDSMLQVVELQGETRFVVPPMTPDLTGIHPPKGIRVSTSGAELGCTGGDFTVTTHGDTTDVAVAERKIVLQMAMPVPMKEYILVFGGDSPAPKRVMSGERARLVRGALVKLPSDSTPQKP